MGILSLLVLCFVLAYPIPFLKGWNRNISSKNAVLFVLFLWSIAYAPSFAVEPNKNILVLNSYHAGFEWTDDVLKGIHSVFKRNDRTDLFIEFMDTRRFDKKKYLEIVNTYLASKYVNDTETKIDLIICSDDNALDFLLANRREFFPGIPIVFCGVNPYNEGRIPLQAGITGVIEQADIPSTLRIALSVRPNPRQFYIFYNGSPTDRIMRKTVDGVLNARFNTTDVVGKNVQEVNSILSQLNSSDMALFLSTPYEWMRYLEEDARPVRDCKAPIFTCWDTFLGYGILGGCVVSGFKHGETAAQMAERILQGDDADSIPIVLKSPNDFKFDYRQMKKFGIRESDLPPGSIFVNREETLYSKYYYWIWGCAFFIVFLTVFCLILFVNLTRRKKAEEAMRISETRLSLALNAANEGLWDFNPQTREIHYLSPKWYTMLGYDPYEFPQTFETFRMFVHPDDLPATEKKVWALVAAGKNYNVEFRMRDKSGKYRWILSRGQIVERDPNGIACRMVGTHVDITEQKELEEHLRQSQKMESVGLMAGGIAHDFNNLLTTIIGYSDLALHQMDASHPFYKFINEIRKAGERATMLTRQLLAFSRKQILEPKVLNLNDLILNMDKMLRRLIGESIELITVPENGLNSIKADPGQIEQVVMNLIVNARDAMPDGGKIIIETRNALFDEEMARKHIDAEAGQYVMLAVSDNGCGIDSETRKRIFDPFFTTKEKGKGTGLGLSMVYGIVKQSGGNIFVYSEPGYGSTFKIYLPCTDEIAPEKTVESKSSIPLRGNETILVVEDEEMVRSLVIDVLKETGYTVFDCSCGAEALQFCERYPKRIDLLLTDVILPKFSGRVLAEQLAAQRSEMKVLYMSGYTDTAIVQHGMLQAGIHFLQKPFFPEALIQKVRDILDEE